MTPKPLRHPKPTLVLPASPALPGSTPAYARGIRLGAIRVRRDLADECRRIACDAGMAGDLGEAHRMHCEADLAEAEIERLAYEIGEIR